MAQEALTNAARHSDADKLTIRLAGDAEWVTLTIQDDGKGFNPTSRPPGHYGLQNMSERAESAGGSLTIESSDGNGSTVTIKFPT